MFNIPFCLYKKNWFACYVVLKFCCLLTKRWTSRLKHKGTVPRPNLEISQHNHLSLSLSSLPILGKYLTLTFKNYRQSDIYDVFSRVSLLSVYDALKDEGYIVVLHIKPYSIYLTYQYTLLYTISNNIEVYKEPVPRTKIIP